MDNNRPRNPTRTNRSNNGNGAARNDSGPRGNAPRSNTSFGAAVRAQKRSQADAQKIANQYAAAAPLPEGAPQERRANFIDDSPRLKIIGLGGMDGGGSKNMILVEYMN